MAVLDCLFDLANDVQWQPHGGWQLGSHPRAVFILGGDVHSGVIHAITSHDRQRHWRNPHILHVTSSTISRAPTENQIYAKAVAHIREGLSIGEWDIVKSLDGLGVDFDELTSRVFGDETAAFTLDSVAGRRYFTHVINMVVERNYGRIEVSRADPHRRAYTFNISVSGETKRLRQAFQIELPDSALISVLRRDVSTSMPWVFPVSRGPDKVDIFTSAGDKGIHTAAWEPGPGWRGWQRVGAEFAPPGACISAVSRNLDHLDLFAVANDSHVCTAWWSAGQGQWGGWQQIIQGTAAPGTPVAAVSRRPDLLDVFVVGDNRDDKLGGYVYTAWWNPGLAQWGGWQQIGDIRVPHGGTVTAVARNPDALDIFVVDVDGRVMTNAWSQGKAWWPQWRHINGGRATPGSRVAAVSRGPDKLDIFVVGTDGLVHTAAWEPSFTDWFHGWWQVGDARVPPGGHVTAISRGPDLLDVFVADNESRIVTNAWSPGNEFWANWVQVQGGLAVPGVPVAAVSRSRDKLDLFVVGLDGLMYNAAWEPAPSWRGWWPLSWPPYFQMPNP